MLCVYIDCIDKRCGSGFQVVALHSWPPRHVIEPFVRRGSWQWLLPELAAATFFFFSFPEQLVITPPMEKIESARGTIFLLYVLLCHHPIAHLACCCVFFPLFHVQFHCAQYIFNNKK